MFEFGNWLTRLLRGGIALAPAEQWLLSALVSNLPAHLQVVAEQQLSSYNLAQREVDGRSINFYRKPVLLPGMPMFGVAEETPLIRLTASVAGSDDLVHATLNAVGGRVFCMSLSRPVVSLPGSGMQIVKVSEAWRSSFPASAPNNSFKPKPLRGSA